MQASLQRQSCLLPMPPSLWAGWAPLFWSLPLLHVPAQCCRLSLVCSISCFVFWRVCMHLLMSGLQALLESDPPQQGISKMSGHRSIFNPLAKMQTCVYHIPAGKQTFTCC